MNSVISAVLVSWFVAQIIKVVYGSVKYGLQDRSCLFWRIIWAGGMPSAHSAVITSAAVTILNNSGIESPIFGLAAVMWIIVIYDRGRMYSIYNTFQKKYPDFARDIQNDPLLIDLVGHRISEIIVGIIIGASVGIIMAMM